jgi:hypothetical protein
MSLTDSVINRSDIEQADIDLRKQARRAINAATEFCTLAGVLTSQHGKAALSAQLGDDAAEFAALYGDARTIANDIGGGTFPALSELP